MEESLTIPQLREEIRKLSIKVLRGEATNAEIQLLAGLALNLVERTRHLG